MEKNGQERFQESTWKIFSDPSITSIVIEPTIEVIEIQPKINKIKFSSGLVGKATLNQIDMVVAALALAELRLVSVFALIPPPPTTHHPH